MSLTNNQIFDLYLEERRLRLNHRDGTPTGTADQEMYALREARAATFGDPPSPVGDLPASAMTPKVLWAVVRAMEESGRLNRATINKRLGVIKSAYKWAAHPAQDHVSTSVYRDLELIEPLAVNRTPAREPRKVVSVPLVDVSLTCLQAPPRIEAMIKAQLSMLARPNETCMMHVDHIDTSGKVWVYRPPRHKTQWKGKDCTRFVPPAAQDLLLPWLSRAKQHSGWLWEGVRNGLPSGRPIRRLSYAQAIRRAAERADVDHWALNQLRHAGATYLEPIVGKKVVQMLLGHSNERTTDIYLDPNLQPAINAMLGYGRQAA